MPRTIKFKNLPLNLTGASVESRTVSATAQRTVNFYPEINEGGKGRAILQPWPSLQAFGSPMLSGKNRGLNYFKGYLYQIIETSLYKIDKLGTYSFIALIPGNDYCSMQNNGFVLLINGNKKVYQWDGVELIELEFAIPTTNISYLNNQFIIDGTDGRFAVLDVGASTLTSTNYGTPESAPDPYVRGYVFNQLLHLFGTRTIEPWENTGVGFPPFERMNGAIIEDIGLCGKNAITHTPDAMYFISPQGDAYMANIGQAVKISKPAQSHAFQSYELSDCIASTVNFESSRFVVFSFPSSGKTWAYSEQVRDWFELDSGAQGGRYQGQEFIWAFNKNLTVNYATGQLYELMLDNSPSVNTVRERTIQGINGELIGKPGQRLQMSRLWLTVQANGVVGGLSPQIMVQPSYDGGRTWGKEYFINTGRTGQNVYQVKWDNMHTFYDMVIRIRISDPVYCSILAGSIDLREAGY